MSDPSPRGEAPPPTSAWPRVVVLMGVSGSGKSTVGGLLAERLGWELVDADYHHPPENVRKMRSGQPLDEQDREPWLRALRQRIDRHLPSEGQAEDLPTANPLVLACSALRRSHRRILGTGRPGVAVVHLSGPRPVLEERLRRREGHFLPPELLESQLATLEDPADEGLVLDIRDPPESLCRQIAVKLAAGRP